MGIPENDLNLHIRSPYANCPDSQFASSVALCQLQLVAATYALTGTTATHPSNHFGTSLFINSVVPGIASDWFNVTVPYALVPPLAINDMSLIDGGVFDLSASWTTPHKAHRWGDEADIGSGGLPAGVSVNPGDPTMAYWLPAPQRQRLRAILATYHYRAINEASCQPGVSETPCNHYHIRPMVPSAPLKQPSILN